MTSSASISACEPAGRPGRAPRPDSGRGVAARAGVGELAVIRSQDRSVVSRAFATSPLRFLTPANHGHAAWIYTSTYGGGLVNGDAVDMRITVGAGAGAFVSTQASTKVYRSPLGTRSNLRADIADDGLLVIAPDPVVCFADATYRQTQQVDIADRGGLVLLDWVSSGRRAAGERWAFDEYVSRTVVRQDGRLLVHDGLALRASDGDIALRMTRFDVLALVIIVGDAFRREVESLMASVAAMPIVRRADELMAIAPIGDGGCVLRLAGRSTEQMGRRIRQVLGFVPALLGDDPWKRKW